MPAWVHRTTKDYLRSIAEADLPEAVVNYIEESAEAATLFSAGVPTIYWKITGDLVEEMTAGEKAAVDAAALSDQRDDTAAELDDLEALMRAYTLADLDAYNSLVQWIEDFNTEVAAATSLGNLQSRIAGISVPNQGTMAQMKSKVRNKLGT